MHRALVALALLLPAAASAVPLELTHQGRLLDDAGDPLDGAHDITATLHDAETGGGEVWSEEHADVTFDAGYFHLVLGSVTPLEAGDFGGSLWLSLAVDGSEIPGRVPLKAVPYAVVAHGVSGGVVDASEIQVGGTTVVDSDGLVVWDAVDVPDDLSDGDSDTLRDLGVCGDGDVAVYDAGSWACSPVTALDLDAGALVTGTVHIDRLPVGTTDLDVAAGDHTHDAADIVSGTLDPSLLGGGNEDGTTEDAAAASCQAVLHADPRADSGKFWLDPEGDGAPWQAWCEMDREGGGWVDVVRTFHLPGQDVAAVTEFFFSGLDGLSLDGSAETNVAGTDGILLQSAQGGSHQQAFYLMPTGLRYSSARTTWRMQGSDENYRCGSSNWIPLSGPGYDGGYDGYLAACPDGYSCIQGRPTGSRDAPIRASYSIDALTHTSTLLTWSGSNTGAQSLNCSRDPNIPIDEPALFIEQLLVR